MFMTLNETATEPSTSLPGHIPVRDTAPATEQDTTEQDTTGQDTTTSNELDGAIDVVVHSVRPDR